MFRKGDIFYLTFLVIAYIPFPEHLKGAYQSYTQADITQLRDIGYDKAFLTVEQGVADYLTWLHGENSQ